MPERQRSGGPDGAACVPLPSGLPDPRTTAGGIFDRIAGLYHRARPGYPSEAVADLKRRCRIDSSRRILEIGCGTGQLTRDLAPAGATMRCIEPGPSLAEIARASLARYPKVEVVRTTFEDFEDQPGSYDLAVSATAFHWIDFRIAFSKVAALLRPGGWLALLTNAHAQGGTHAQESFAEPVRALHRRFAHEVGTWTFPTAEQIQHNASAGGNIAAVWISVERKLSEPPDVAYLFEPPRVKTYPWLATYERDAYLDMLASQSSYALIEEDRRTKLLAGIGRLVDERLRGVVTKQYVTVLAAAKTAKRASSRTRLATREA